MKGVKGCSWSQIVIFSLFLLFNFINSISFAQGWKTQYTNPLDAANHPGANLLGKTLEGGGAPTWKGKLKTPIPIDPAADTRNLFVSCSAANPCSNSGGGAGTGGYGTVQPQPTAVPSAVPPPTGTPGAGAHPATTDKIPEGCNVTYDDVNACRKPNQAKYGCSTSDFSQPPQPGQEPVRNCQTYCHWTCFDNCYGNICIR
jgi:hypothetical protein